MPKILVKNLPVTTQINAEVEVEDGPDSTLQERISDAVWAGRWQRARGRLEESLEDLDLSPDERALENWSFEAPVPGPPAPAPMTGFGYEIAFEGDQMGCATLGCCEREGRDRAEEERRYAEFLTREGYDVVSVKDGVARVRVDAGGIVKNTP